MDIFAMIKNGNVEALKQAIETNPAIVNVKNDKGFTPLIMATYTENKEIAKLLIQHGADVDAKDNAGNTALMGVSFKGHIDLARFLIENGALVNASNFNNSTALIYSATFNKPDMVKMLLAQGADKTMEDSRGNDAFSHATHQGNEEIIALLK